MQNLVNLGHPWGFNRRFSTPCTCDTRVHAAG